MLLRTQGERAMSIRIALDWIKGKFLAENYNPHHGPDGRFASASQAGAEGIKTVPYRGTRVHQKLVERGLAKPWEPKGKKPKEEKLPELKGSEKQIKWAENIRKGILGKLKDAYTSNERMGGSAFESKETFYQKKEAIKNLHDDLAKLNKASAWINARSILSGREVHPGYAVQEAHADTVKRIRGDISRLISTTRSGGRPSPTTEDRLLGIAYHGPRD